MKKILFAVFFLITNILFATDYYFSNTGNDSNLGTTEGAAFQTLTKFHSLPKVGNRFYFKRGDSWIPTSPVGTLSILQFRDIHGTESNPIVVGAYGTGADPIISKANAGYVRGVVVLESSASHIHIQGIDFQRGDVAFYIKHSVYGKTQGIHDIKINNCKLMNVYTHNGFDGYDPVNNPSLVPNSMDATTNPIYKIEFGDNIFEQRFSGTDDAINMIMGVRYIDANGDVLECGSGNLLASSGYANRGRLNLTTGAMPDTNFWIHGNTFYDSKDEAIDLPGGNLHLIERNKFYGSRVSQTAKWHSEYNHITDCIFRNNLAIGAAYITGLGATAYGFAWEGIEDCIIENNTASNVFGILVGDNDQTGNQALYGDFTGNIFRNNNWYGGMTIIGTDIIDNITDVNTFENNNYWINSQFFYDWRLIRYYENGAVSSRSISADASPVSGSWGTFTNIWVNLLNTTNEKHFAPQMQDAVWDMNHLVASGDYTTYLLSTLLYGGSTSGGGALFDQIPEDFGDYSLKSTSPLIDAGTVSVTVGSTDINGNPRVQGGYADIGAYEFPAGDTPAQLSWNYNPFNLGTVDTGATVVGLLRGTNAGTVEDIRVTIDSATAIFPSANFEIIYGDTAGAVLSPSETITIAIRTKPKSVASVYNGSISIEHTSTVQNTPTVIPLSYTVTSESVVMGYSGDTAKVFTTELGAELVSNFSFANWEGGLPVGWYNDGVQSDPIGIWQTVTGVNIYTTSVPPDQTPWVSVKQSLVPLTTGIPHVYKISVTQQNSGSLKYESGADVYTFDSVGVFQRYYIPNARTIYLGRNVSSGTTDLDVDYFSIKAVTGDYDGSISITNTSSTIALTCTNISFLNGEAFELTSASSFSNVLSGSPFDITFRFMAPDSGWFVDTLRMTGLNDGTYSTKDFIIQGYFASAYDPYAVPVMDFSIEDLLSTGLYWGVVDTGSYSDSTIYIKNTGLDTLNVTVTDDATGAFTVLNPIGATEVLAGDSVALTIRFEPQALIFTTEGIYIENDDPASPSSVGFVVGGTGGAVTDPNPILTTNPTDTLDFGTANIGSFVTKTLYITNVGSASLTYAPVINVDTDFQITGGSSSPTAVSETDSIIITVLKSTVNTFYGNIRLTTNDPSNITKNIVLKFPTIDANPLLSISSTNVNFGTVNIPGGASTSVTLRNEGDGVLNGVVGYPYRKNLGATNESEPEIYTPFANNLVGGNFSFSLGAGATRTLQWTFTPSDELNYLFYQDVIVGTDTTTITLRGVGNYPATLALSPPSYNFGDVNIGTSKISPSLFIYNKGKDSINVTRYLKNNISYFTSPDTVTKKIGENKVINGTFDTDSAWVFYSASSYTQKLQFFSTNNTAYAKQYIDLTQNTRYLFTADVAGHIQNSGENLTVSMGGASVSIPSSSYQNGKLAISVLAETTDTLTLKISGVFPQTTLDNITVSDFVGTTTSNKVFFTSGGSATDSLVAEHDTYQTSPMYLPLEGSTVYPSFEINGTIEIINGIKLKDN